jgi:hypothetical protein
MAGILKGSRACEIWVQLPLEGFRRVSSDKVSWIANKTDSLRHVPFPL